MQYIYSQAIIDFICLAKSHAKQILQCEMNIQVLKSRFAIGNMRYPLHIVVFENANLLGYFDAKLLEIGLSKHLIDNEKELFNILRHELAHYYCYIVHGDLTHSPLFRSTCKRFGWDKSVYQAKTFIDKPSNAKISSKIQKLLALSTSSNPHEAQNALIKANQLLLTHSHISSDLALRRVLSAKRAHSKWSAISDILRTFGVHPVFNRGQGISYLEVFGPAPNVATADYVAAYLDRELTLLWKTHGKGLPSSFFDGIAKGYLKKIKPVQKPFKPGLIALENTLEESLWMPYPHLQHTQRLKKTCPKSLLAGYKLGQNLTIRNPIESGHQAFYLE